MLAVIFDDVRRMVLGLLFVVAFGWMAAQLLPGSPERFAGGGGAAQLAASSEAGIIHTNP
jgi:acyl CoA:acetate/3-ketoacid CoA transferase beta subunit